MLENGRPVFETNAYRDHHARTVKVLEFINREKITDGDGTKPTTLSTELIRGVDVDIDKSIVPAFTYPIFSSKENGVLIDDRPYRRPDNTFTRREAIGDMVIDAVTEYYWNTNISRFSSLATNVSAFFGTLLSSCFKRRLNFDFKEQAYIRAYYGLYYLLKFKSEEELGRMVEDDFEYLFYSMAVSTLKLSKEIAEDLYSTSGMVKVVTYLIENVKSSSPGSELLEVFCENLPEVLNSPSIRTFDHRALYDMTVSSVWVGTNKIPMTMAMLEHPPTLITMITIAEVRKSFYKKTLIGLTGMGMKMLKIDVGAIGNAATEMVLDLEEQ